MEWLLFFILFLLGAFFSSSETAYVASNRLKLRLKAHEQKKDKKLFQFLTDAPRFLTTTLVGNNVVIVACSSASIVLLSPYLSETLLVLITTVFLLLFSEILPKSIAQQIPNRFLKVMGGGVNLFYYLLLPLIKLARLMSQVLVRMFGGVDLDVETFFKKSDLPILIREYSSSSTLSKEDRELVNRAVVIGDKRLHDVMVHRTEIIGVEMGTSIDEIISLFRKTGYSRFPIYEDSLDDVRGFIYVLDILNTKASEPKSLIRPAVFFPETMRAINALHKLRKKRISVAIVVDEHGGTAGLVSIEDIVEELFGEIADEYDKEAKITKRGQKSIILTRGREEIEELVERYGLNIPKGDYVTLAGFIEAQLGHIPNTFPKQERKFVCRILK
ncbi:MAG: HlyC/CorC family transporter [Calditrichaeota bacterium]|nr:HlyC/CorC family transporter [Calditrichota bacterium]